MYASRGKWDEKMNVKRLMRGKVLTKSGGSSWIEFDEAFEVVNRMLLSGEVLNEITFLSVLSACSSTASFEMGKNCHAKAIKLGFLGYVYVGTGLTDMYAKCGEMISSRKVFNWMPERDEFSWTVMIHGLAKNGFAEESIELFEEMERTSSITPNALTFSTVLFACSHPGLVDKGLALFNSMETRYGVKPNARHYTCVVNMLSRSGRLSEAEAFIESMPVLANGAFSSYAALLSACLKLGDGEVAERTAKKFLELADNKNSAAGHVVLSNMYASLGKWDEALNVRRLMREKGLKKCGGRSWIKV
ncbi:pentatricopeptide repeat-containing protein At1g28690, mitochondrial-like [Punica granatum]|nr:pentatricopeptide repeat-containing protein At1g28690, mitochondrial-like [Punica granatum]PKI55189.1 hypothetical protein CRG98_024480 [Punica granatum]